MSSVVSACRTWFRRNWKWSNSRQAWGERGGALLLLTGAGLLVGFASRLSLTQLVIFWGLLLVALAVLLRRGWLKLFGPVLFYDMVRAARRGRYFLIRSLYALFLLLVLTQVALSAARAGSFTTREAAQAALAFFFTFMAVQVVVASLLTPAYVAGAIAEEKDRKTLEFLLATDLRNREIVLSKLGARLANLALIVLTGLPILGLVQFMGGVDPELVLAGFAFTGLTILGLAGLSIFVSVYLKRPRDAIALTYLGAVAYLALALTGLGLLAPGTTLGGVPLTWGDDPYTVADLVDAVNAGNLIYVVGQVSVAMSRGSLAAVVPGLLGNYALFHGLVFLGFTGLAVWRLRAVAFKQAEGRVQKRAGSGHARPRVGNAPMVWKEVFVESGFRFHWLGTIILLVLVGLSLLPVVLIFYFNFFEYGRGTWEDLGWPMNGYVRGVGTCVACLSLLAVAVRAASAIGSERDRQTLDALLTSPLDSNAILFAKWLGSILCVRGAWLWLGVIWGLGVITGGISLFAVPVLIIAWLIYATVLASLGLWFSVVCRTTTRATVITLLVALGAGVGHWFLTSCCFIGLRTAGRAMETVAKLEAGFTPPFVLGVFAFKGEELLSGDRWARDEFWQLAGYSVLGLFCTLVAAGALWLAAAARFQFVTGRQALRHPDRPDLYRGAARSRRIKSEDRFVPPGVVAEVVEEDSEKDRPDEGPDSSYRRSRGGPPT
jgi:ABC-type transport system involved in multi-copper enzyme maturation permease subunit